MTNRVLGIDPGLRNTGWAVLDLDHKKNNQASLIACGSIKTSSGEEMDHRLLSIFKGISSLVEEFSPSFAAIENTYVNTNFNTSLQLSQARAAAILGVANFKIKITPYPATTIKKTVCGSGNADKTQIAKILKLLIPNFIETKDKDAIDAVAVALCHSYHSNLSSL